MHISAINSDVIVFWFFTFVRSYSSLVVFQGVRSYLRHSGLIVCSLVLSLNFVSNSMPVHPLSIPNIWSFVVALLGEVYIGVLLGLPLALALEALVMSGRMADVCRGAQFGEQLNPLLGGMVSPLENIMILGALGVVLSLGGHTVLLTALSFSVTDSTLAPGAVSLGVLSVDSSILACEQLISLSARAIGRGLLIAGPVLVAALAIDIAGAFISRVLGRVNVVIELMPLKLLVGLVMFSLILSLFHPHVITFFREAASHQELLLVKFHR